MRLALLTAAIALVAQAPRDEVLEVQRFGELLRRFRAGESALLAELEQSGARLCADFKRCDATALIGYYAALAPDDRARGLEAEKRYEALWDEAWRAGEAEVAGIAWLELRDELLEDLRYLVDRTVDAPDFVPAARSLALCAELEIDELERSHSLTAVERGELAARIEADCERALALFARAGHKTPQLEPRWVLGRLQALRGRLGEARKLFEQVLADATSARRDDYEERALRGLIGVARDAGDVAEVERLLGELAKLRDPRECWPLARDWAALLFHADHAARTLDFLARHPPQADEGNAAHEEWELLMGAAALRAGDLEAAAEHYESITRPSEPALLGTARLLLARKRFPEAAALLDPEEPIEGLSPQGAVMLHAFLGEAHLRCGRVPRATSELARALDLALRREQGLDVGPRLDASERAALNVIGEWDAAGLSTVALLAEAHALAGEHLEAARLIEDVQSRSLRGAGLAPVALTTTDLLSAARDTDVGLVTWIVGADSGVVAHVARDGSALAVPLPYGRHAVADAGRRLREAVLADDRAAIARLASEVRAALLPDAIAKRLGSGGGQLLLLLHGPMEALPVEVLPYGASTLDEAFELALLPGLPLGVAAAQPSSPRHWQLLGAPVGAKDGKTDLPELAGARAELDQLAQLCPEATLAAGTAFDRAALEAALASGDALHVATHLVRSCPSAGQRFPAVGLALSGGAVFCAQELATAAAAPPLVVLAACETGGGASVDAEGMQGLARAFLAAGTRDLVVTQWPVADAAAAKFALSFHGAYLRGATPLLAARAARAELRAAGRPAADWAAFRALGVH